MKSSPLPYWIRQLEEVLRTQACALDAGCGMKVVLQIKPGGHLEPPIVTVFSARSS